MTDLECLIEWLKTYDGYDILGSCQVDYRVKIKTLYFSVLFSICFLFFCKATIGVTYGIERSE